MTAIRHSPERYDARLKQLAARRTTDTAGRVPVRVTGLHTTIFTDNLK